MNESEFCLKQTTMNFAGFSLLNFTHDNVERTLLMTSIMAAQFENKLVVVTEPIWNVLLEILNENEMWNVVRKLSRDKAWRTGELCPAFLKDCGLALSS